MTTPTALWLPARAKLNLVLRIKGRRADGYHLLETLFHELALHDDLVVRLGAPGASVAVTAERAGLGEDHQATLQTRKMLAEALLMSRDYAAAEPHLRELQRGLRTTLGDQHPAAASTTVTLARCLDQLDRRDDARAVLRSFLAETALPKDHANVAAVQAALERFGQD